MKVWRVKGLGSLYCYVRSDDQANALSLGKECILGERYMESRFIRDHGVSDSVSNLEVDSIEARLATVEELAEIHYDRYNTRTIRQFAEETPDESVVILCREDPS